MENRGKGQMESIEIKIQYQRWIPSVGSWVDLTVKCGIDELEDGEIETTIFKRKEQDGGGEDKNRSSQILGQYQTIIDACN